LRLLLIRGDSPLSLRLALIELSLSRPSELWLLFEPPRLLCLIGRRSLESAIWYPPLLKSIRPFSRGYAFMASDRQNLPDRPDVRRVRALARLLDEAVRIPGTNIRVGLDALIGLLPGGGDLVGALLSGSALLIAHRAGAPASVLGRMVANVALDALIGVVPVLGDLFDVAWKANSRNATLLEEWIARPTEARRASRGVVAGLVVLLVLVVAGAIALSVLVFRALWQLAT
jgi:hypothetical protein